MPIEVVLVVEKKVLVVGKPVIVVIEDGGHGNLKVGFFQGHKWEKTSVEKNVEFDEPAKVVQDKVFKEGIAPGHGEEEANRGDCFVTTLCCPLAEVSPHTSANSESFKVHCDTMDEDEDENDAL